MASFAVGNAQVFFNVRAWWHTGLHIGRYGLRVSLRGLSDVENHLCRSALQATSSHYRALGFITVTAATDHA